MSPSEAIAMLDRFLETDGKDCILRRVYGTAGNIIVSDVTVRAKVSAYSETELVGGIVQTDSRVIMSPSQITAAQWPGGELTSSSVPDPTLPRRNDKLIVDGRVRNVEFVNPADIGGTLVRIEMRIAG